MPAQKRPLTSTNENYLHHLQHRPPAGDGDGGGGTPPDSCTREQIQRVEVEVEVVEEVVEEEEEEQEEEEMDEKVEQREPVLQRCDEKRADSDVEDGGSPSSSSAKDEYIIVRLADIRKEVQCPICLGIIRKTRTVMECLHRFCRECIDKSMRLGNNECPACRTHCASRRSLRDDPNYDALIAALYPDIDKYEEEELAFHEEENNRNKKIQASIAETLRRQTEALGKRRPTGRAAAAAITRKSGNFRRGRTRSYSRDTGAQGSDDEDEDGDGNDVGKDSSSADERPDIRPKRFRRRPGPRLSPALGTSSADGGCDEHDDSGGRETRGASPGRVGNREVLVWGKGGARSQTRHGSGSGTNGKNVKGSRITKLVDYLRNLDDKENEYDLHLSLLPLDKETVPRLERPYICCRPTLSIKQICQFIAHETSIHAEEIEILVKKPRIDTSPSVDTSMHAEGQINTLEDELQILEAQESLSGLPACFSSSPGNLVLVYRAKN